jgi:hypothetical protein
MIVQSRVSLKYLPRRKFPHPNGAGPRLGPHFLLRRAQPYNGNAGGIKVANIWEVFMEVASVLKPELSGWLV